jgi:hypothetical protein
MPANRNVVTGEGLPTGMGSWESKNRTSYDMAISIRDFII